MLNSLGNISSSSWPRGPMAKAPAYGAGDSRFEPWRGRFDKILKQVFQVNSGDDISVLALKERDLALAELRKLRSVSTLLIKR